MRDGHSVQRVHDNVSLTSVGRRTEAIHNHVCGVIAGQMEPCFLPLEGGAIVSCIVLGERWLQAVETLVRIQGRADPSRKERAGRLLLALGSYCQRVDRRSTPAAFRERTDACRRITESVAQRMSEHLGRRYIAFESSNPFVPFRTRSPSALDAIPFAVGIAEIEGLPLTARTTGEGDQRGHG